MRTAAPRAASGPSPGVPLPFAEPLSIVVLGLSITSSWGNGHATTYRALVRELARRGHRVLFLERDVPWYADHRDLPRLPWGKRARVELYGDRAELEGRFAGAVEAADLVLVGSYVPEGVAVARWALGRAARRAVTAFYDIDTPVTLAKLARGDHEYIEPGLVSRFDLYLSFTGGATLERLERELGAPRALPLYCSVDPERYYPAREAETLGSPGSNGEGARPASDEPCWDLGYLGTYSDDRQPRVDELLVEPARRFPEGRFAVAGPGYPDSIDWPANVERTDHLPPGRHRGFYTAQRFTLNVTRDDMIEAGWSPSVRLFEAAACGVPIVSDRWEGIDAFFTPGEEILLPSGPDEVLGLLRDLPEDERRAVGERARRRILDRHTAAARAATLERYVREARSAGTSTLAGATAAAGHAGAAS